MAKNKNIKVAVGMSGGVDSSVAAALLVEQGYRVTGVFLECWKEPGCKTDPNRKDALKVGLRLKLPMKVLDFKKEYKKRVMDWFYRELKQGRTPNPDVVCNQEIKFGLFLDWALKNGFDYVATGHYARIGRVINHALSATDSLRRPARRSYLHTRCNFSMISKPSKLHLRKLAEKQLDSLCLLQAKDRRKDQTYFLAMLKQKQLARVMFPIGHLTKTEVRQEAKKRGLHVWNKKDSTGICFIGHDLSFEEFVKKRIKPHEGEVVNIKGKVIGRHKGVEFYTIGQRHGFDTNAKCKGQNAKPLYVVSKNIKNNRLVVGERKGLLRDSFEVEEWSWINHQSLIIDHQLHCRIRHGGRLVSCRIDGNRVKLKEKVFGVAPGQVAVLYRGEECLGGGMISDSS